MSKFCFGLMCSAIFLSGSAWAATLVPGEGTLTVNQGQGFQPVNARVDTNVGDSVMVAPGGTATLVYDDGCKVDVQPGSVTTVAPISPCASGSYAQGNNNDSATALGALAVIGGVTGVIVYEGTRSTNGPSSP
jgi:hypothetical protein